MRLKFPGRSLLLSSHRLPLELPFQATNLAGGSGDAHGSPVGMEGWLCPTAPTGDSVGPQGACRQVTCCSGAPLSQRDPTMSQRHRAPSLGGEQGFGHSHSPRVRRGGISALGYLLSCLCLVLSEVGVFEQRE